MAFNDRSPTYWRGRRPQSGLVASRRQRGGVTSGAAPVIPRPSELHPELRLRDSSLTPGIGIVPIPSVDEESDDLKEDSGGFGAPGDGPWLPTAVVAAPLVLGLVLLALGLAPTAIQFGW